MKEINISFKELIDYVKDKDFEIQKLQCNLKEMTYERNKYRESVELLEKWLKDNGITLVIERNKMHELKDEKKEEGK